MVITANTIEAALRRLPELPTPISSRYVETGPDSTDDPAVCVWAILKDDEVNFAERSRLRSIIRVVDPVKAGSSMLVSVRFPGASEIEPET